MHRLCSPSGGLILLFSAECDSVGTAVSAVGRMEGVHQLGNALATLCSRASHVALQPE